MKKILKVKKKKKKNGKNTNPGHSPTIIYPRLLSYNAETCNIPFLSG